MQNLLIIENELIYSHFLANSICKEFDNIRLYNIVDTGQKSLEIIDEQIADIIILDLRLPDISGIEILDYIRNSKIQKYLSSIIAITSDTELLNKVLGNEYIYSYYSKIDTINSIINIFQQLLDYKSKCLEENPIKLKILSELKKLKFDFSYIGTKYLYECIFECYTKNSIYNINLSQNIYPILAQKYQKTCTSIKTSIFQSISIMYYEIEEDKLFSYLGYYSNKKPKAKDIIYAILQKL